MVGTFEGGVLRFLTDLGRHDRAGDIEELARAGSRTRRTLQRWMRDLGRSITYYPNIRYEAFGLRHLHAFIDEPLAAHATCAYAGDAAWVASGPGKTTLYLHCLVPAEHVTHLSDLLAGSPHVTIITTGDSWQDNDLTSISNLGAPRRRHIHTLLPRPRSAPPMALARAYALILPVSTELLGRRATMREVWEALATRMGERIWEYLPKRSRRWRHNGSAYARRAFDLLNTYGLVTQHIVRFAGLREHTVEMFLLVRTIEDLEPLRAHTPLLEFFPGTEAVLVRAHGDITFLKAVLRSEAIIAWWLINEERAPPAVRVRIEDFYDPTTGSWRRP